ncbi:glucan endo-1,3-beta-glucosidase 14-like [Apium graveolens]|uniref:glucan endo-1,3-beta-glucosidase 14-like n=1 Tax=Apium graveolens TaxID=4045 RepID=UPI003D7A7978
MILEKFVRKYGEELGGRVTLNAPSGAPCPVEVERKKSQAHFVGNFVSFFLVRNEFSKRDGAGRTEQEDAGEVNKKNPVVDPEEKEPEPKDISTFLMKGFRVSVNSARVAGGIAPVSGYSTVPEPQSAVAQLNLPVHQAYIELVPRFCRTRKGNQYGQIGNNLPQPEKVLELLRSLRITKARIYDTNPQILTAFAHSGVELSVTVPNEMLGVLMDPQQATHIKPNVPATRITDIAVGNEVFTGDDTSLVAKLVPAIISIHGALVQLGLDQNIQVSTPSSLAVLANSYRPSAGSFQPELTGIMTQFLHFLSTTKSPFWINAYPYFAYKDSPNGISLDYVLFNPNIGMVDPYTKLHYDNMLYAQVDSVLFAMLRLGFGGIEVRVSETGWPSKDDQDEVGANARNAATYTRNLLRRQYGNEGTPLRPKMRVEVYLFALFNENMKPGPTSERNYGLYQPDLSMAYDVGILGSSSTSSTPTSTSASTSTSTSTVSISLISSVSHDNKVNSDT